jgi:hypothetical protein
MARERKSKVNVDPGQIASQSYNQAAGAQKVAEVGRHLVPLKSNATTFTTNATTAIPLPSMGRNLAVYNNANAVGAVTLSDVGTVTSQAPGAIDAAGNPGIPCKPNDWTYIACNEKNWVIASAATLLVFLIEDDTSK